MQIFQVRLTSTVFVPTPRTYVQLVLSNVRARAWVRTAGKHFSICRGGGGGGGIRSIYFKMLKKTIDLQKVGIFLPFPADMQNGKNWGTEQADLQRTETSSSSLHIEAGGGGGCRSR